MKDEQYATILKMFANLGEQIQGLRQEMTSEFKKVRKEMACELKNVRQEVSGEFESVRREIKTGTAAQTALSQEILNTVGETFGELQKETRQTKKLHGKRIRTIERYLGLI